MVCFSNSSQFQPVGQRFAQLATYLYPKPKAVELAADPVTPQQSKLVVEFVRAKPQVAPSDTR